MMALFLGNGSVISCFYLIMQVLQTPGGGGGLVYDGGETHYCYFAPVPRSGAESVAQSQT